MEKKEAMEILKELHDKSLFSERTALETLIPELATSEDERIKKELLEYLKDFIPHNDLDLVRKSKVWITWLEKQGKQKLIDKIQLGKKYKCIASPREKKMREKEARNNEPAAPVLIFFTYFCKKKILIMDYKIEKN